MMSPFNGENQINNGDGGGGSGIRLSTPMVNGDSGGLSMNESTKNNNKSLSKNRKSTAKTTTNATKGLDHHND